MLAVLALTRVYHLPSVTEHWFRCALSAFQLLEGRRSIDLHWKWAGK